MTNRQGKILPFDYIGGKEFTSRLVKALGLSQFKELTDELGIGHGTVSTWHTRNQTPFEIAVRVHLASGVSLKWLLLGEGDMYDASKPSISNDKVELPYFQLDKGELLDKGKMFFDPQFLKGMPEAEHLMLVEHEGKKLFVDKEVKIITSGTYLIKIDNIYTVNILHKLPGDKIAIIVENTTITINIDEIKVYGKIE